jgi:two-component system nitrate/nitrite response regulator NarL
MPDPKLSQWFEECGSGLAEMRRRESEKVRVYIVSEVRLYREGLIAVLQRQLEVVGAGGSDDFLDRITATRPDVLLLDLAARGSLTIPRRARQVIPEVRVVAFSVAEIDDDILACAEAGISGYVMQDGSSEDLIAAVLSALKGELACSPRIAGLLFHRMATLSDGRPVAAVDAPLTPREREIAAMVARNLPNKEIARQMRLGPATVKNHVHSILQKLNIHRRGDVARLRLDGDR